MTTTEKPIKTASYVMLPVSLDNRAKIGLEDGREALTGRITNISNVFMWEGWLYATFTTINSVYQNVPVYISQNRLSGFSPNEVLADESIIRDKYGQCYSINMIMGISEDGIVIQENNGDYLITRFM